MRGRELSSLDAHTIGPIQATSKSRSPITRPVSRKTLSSGFARLIPFITVSTAVGYSSHSFCGLSQPNLSQHQGMAEISMRKTTVSFMSRAGYALCFSSLPWLVLDHGTGLNKEGEYAGVSMYASGEKNYAVCTENGARAVPFEPLLAGDPTDATN